MRNTKVIGAILGIVLFITLIAGLTYAYATWSSGNINKQVSSKCFDVLYDKGQELSGAIMPSDDYTGGLYSVIRLNINTECNVTAKGRLHLTTDEDTSSNLYREGLLNYQVMRNGNTVIASGNITKSGEIIIDLGLLAQSETAFTRYEIYVWIDNNLVENSDVGSVYYGNISAEAVQADGNYDLPIFPEDGYNLVDYITNLYNSTRKTIVTNGPEGEEIEYNYASSVNLMNDRLGGTTSDYDAGNIRYYGADPNNYVDIGDRTSDGKVIPYRIIGVFKDVELSDGTTEDLIKVIRADSIGSYVWDNKTSGIGSSVDSYGSNDWSDSRLMMILNPGYDKYNEENPLLDDSGDIVYGYEGSLWWNSKSGTCYSGTNNGTESCNFTSTGLSTAVQSKIKEVIWNLGGPGEYDIYSNGYYEYERGDEVYSGRPTEWTGKVALMYPSDYGYATDFNSCKRTLYYYETSGCYNNDWLYITNVNQWQLTPDSSYSSYARYVFSPGCVYNSRGYYAYGVRPVFYLDSELGIEFGDGTKERPYVLG